MRIAGTIELDGSTITLDQAGNPTTITTSSPTTPITLALPALSATLSTTTLTETLENKTLTPTSVVTLTDSNFTLVQGGGSTKFALAATAARTITIPDATTTMVGIDVAQTLTLKSIDGNTNTLTNIDLPALKTQAGDADKVLRRDALGAIISGNTLPNASPLVTTDAAQILTNKELTAPTLTAGSSFDAASAGDMNIGTTTAATINVGRTGQVLNLLSATTIGSLANPENLTVTGNLYVQGNTTTVNTATLDVEDANITVNLNGTKATAQGAGLTVDSSGDGTPYTNPPRLLFNETLASGWELDKGGAAAVPVEVATVSATQTLTGKTIDGDDNTVQDLALTSLKTTANLNVFLQRDGSGVVVDSAKAVPTGAVVGTTDSQILSAKTLNGGSILLDLANGGSATSATAGNRLILSRQDYGALPAAGTKGALYYDETNDRLVFDNGTDLIAVGFDAGGGAEAAPIQDASLANADFVFENTGVNSNKAVYKKRVGDEYEVWGYLTFGTITAASLAEITVASGNTLASSKLSAQGQKVGELSLLSTPTDERITYDIFYDGSTTNKLYITSQSNGGQYQKVNTDTLFVTGESATFRLRIPIVELGGSFALALTWAPLILTGDATLLVGQEVFARTATAGMALTFTLPSPAQIGDRVRVIDAEGFSATNNIIIDRNGHNINGVADDITIDVNNAALELIYMDTTQGWRTLNLG